MDSHLGNRVSTTAAAKRKRKRNKNKPAIEKVDNHRTNSGPKQEEAKRNNNKKGEGHAHRANRRREPRWKRIASEVRVLQVMAMLILAVMLYFLARTFTAREDRETFAMMRPITEKAIIVKEKATMVLPPLSTHCITQQLLSGFKCYNSCSVLFLCSRFKHSQYIKPLRPLQTCG